jgi:hypothetical protein
MTQQRSRGTKWAAINGRLLLLRLLLQAEHSSQIPIFVPAGSTVYHMLSQTLDKDESLNRLFSHISSSYVENETMIGT